MPLSLPSLAGPSSSPFGRRFVSSVFDQSLAGVISTPKQPVFLLRVRKWVELVRASDKPPATGRHFLPRPPSWPAASISARLSSLRLWRDLEESLLTQQSHVFEFFPPSLTGDVWCRELVTRYFTPRDPIKSCQITQMNQLASKSPIHCFDARQFSSWRWVGKNKDEIAGKTEIGKAVFLAAGETSKVVFPNYHRRTTRAFESSAFLTEGTPTVPLPEVVSWKIFRMKHHDGGAGGGGGGGDQTNTERRRIGVPVKLQLKMWVQWFSKGTIFKLKCPFPQLFTVVIQTPPSC